MKHTLLTLTIASLLAINAFADPIHDAAKTVTLLVSKRNWTKAWM